MKDILKFISFITYIISIFFIDNFLVLTFLLLLNILLMLIFKLSIIESIKTISKLSIFIIITCIFNYFVDGLRNSLLIGFRLLIICNITYIFSKLISALSIGIIIEKLLTPLKILKINPKNIGIIVSIAISFIPILKEELINIRYSLKSKGFNDSYIHLLFNASLLLKPLLVSILNRITEIEYSLDSKGYKEN